MFLGSQNMNVFKRIFEIFKLRRKVCKLRRDLRQPELSLNELLDLDILLDKEKRNAFLKKTEQERKNYENGEI